MGCSIFFSYTIKLMIVHFLQCAIWPPILPNLRKLCPTRFDGVKYCAALGEMRLFDTLPEIPSGEYCSNSMF